jgi:hypothetical protein
MKTTVAVMATTLKEITISLAVIAISFTEIMCV